MAVRRTFLPRSVRVAGAVSLATVLALGGCAKTPAPQAGAPDPVAAASESSTDNPAPVPPGAPVPADLVGAGCANYALRVPAGPGSLTGMGRDPVAAAVSNSALLTTMAGAVSGKLNPDVNLVDTLNAGQFTVFAPTDEAFGHLDPATIEKLKTDDALLTAVLKYHVVDGQADPDKIAGDHKSLQGASLTVSGSGGDLRVNGAAVVCGGIKTANATLYLIDTVLMPPAPAPPPPPGPPAATSATPTP